MLHLKDLKEALPPSRMGTKGQGLGARPLGTAFKTEDSGRPISSLNTAGFVSGKITSKVGDILKKNSEQNVGTPQEQIKKFSKEINAMIEQSAIASQKGNHGQALDFAKQASNRDKNMRKLIQNISGQQNIDLSYSAQFNLALCLQKNGMLQEANSKYEQIIKSKLYSQAGRLHVNIGNIHFEQKNYQSSIKSYRKAIDLVPATSKEMRLRIQKNIGLAQIKLGQFHQAISTYENILKNSTDHKDAAFNLLLCLYKAVGDKLRMKDCFSTMLVSDLYEGPQQGQQQDKVLVNDRLKQDVRTKRRQQIKLILMSAKLISRVIESDVIEGYNWILAKIKNSDYKQAQSQIQIFKAMALVRNKEIEKAIETLKTLEKKDSKVMGKVAANISFLYFLQNDFKNAQKFADIALKHNIYNSKAMVNKGNCLYVKNQFIRAKQHYLQAIGVQGDCIQALYNLAYVNKRLNLPHQALLCLQKLQAIVSIPQVLFQMANIHQIMGNTKQALKYYQLLLNKVPKDAGILARVGNIFFRNDDQQQALHHYMQSYKLLPTNIQTNTWLGIYYVKQQLYQKACHFLQRASQLQPKQVKWKLMVASCHRRIGNYNRSLKIYQAIYNDYPQNVQCLRFLVHLCKDMGLPYEEYATTLKYIQRKQQMDPDPYTNEVQPQQQVEEPKYSERAGEKRQDNRKKAQPKKQEGFEGYDVQLII